MKHLSKIDPCHKTKQITSALTGGELFQHPCTRDLLISANIISCTVVLRIVD